MFIEVQTLELFNRMKSQEPAILCYFSTDTCHVCKVLKPKIEQLIEKEFPKIKLVYIKSDQSPEIAGQFRVFAAPTLLVFFNGLETLRKSRTMGIDEICREIRRPYELLFGDQAPPEALVHNDC